MSDNRPPRYEEDGRVIYRASSLGMCDKVFVALAMGYDPRAHPAWFQEILDEGTENEAVIRGMYETAYDTEVEAVGHVVEMEILDGVWIRGSIDGYHPDGNYNPVLDEFKKIRDSGWMRYLRSGVEFQANYPMQTAFYQFALGEECGIDYVPMHFTGGHYVQDEKTGEWSITEVHTHEYPDPAVPLLAIKRRIAKLERLINETETIGDIDCSTKMYPCPFYYLHDDDDEEPPTRPGDDVVEPLLQEWAAIELEKKSDEYVAWVNRADALVKREKAIKEGVKAWLIASGQESGDVSTVKAGDVEVAVKYTTSPRAGYTVEPTEQTRVTVKVTKRDGETVAKAPGRTRQRRPASEPPGVPATQADEQPPASDTDAKPVKGARKLAPRPG